MKELSRRSFLKGTVAGLGGVAALGAVGAVGALAEGITASSLWKHRAPKSTE